MWLWFVNNQCGGLVEGGWERGDRASIRGEISVPASEQVTALTGLGTLHKREDAGDLVADQQRVVQPLGFSSGAGGKPEGGADQHAGQHRDADRAPVQPSERFRIGRGNRLRHFGNCIRRLSSHDRRELSQFWTYLMPVGAQIGSGPPSPRPQSGGACQARRAVYTLAL